MKNTFLKSQIMLLACSKPPKLSIFGVKPQSLKWFKSTQIFLRYPFSNHHLSDLSSNHSLNSLCCIYTNFAIPLTHWKFSLFKAFANTLDTTPKDGLQSQMLGVQFSAILLTSSQCLSFVIYKMRIVKIPIL